jgi:two-component system sensor histidine kinase SenX3
MLLTVVALMAGLTIGLIAGALTVRRYMMAALRESTGIEDAHRVGSTAEIGRSVKARVANANREVDRLSRIIEQLEAGMEVCRTGVVVCDPDGKIVLRNRVATTFAEARHSEALVTSIVNQLLDSARQGSEDEQVIELVGPPSRAFQVTAHPLAADEETLGAVVFIDDVSETRRIDKVRRDFVTNVSHELKTPIGALSLLAETVTADDDPEVMNRLLGRIRSEAQRVSGTIDDLMTLSAIEESDDSRFELLGVRELVDDAIERLAEAAGLKGIELRPPVAGSELFVLGERVQLESAIFNLVDNAIKYCERGDGVEIRLAEGGGLIAIAVQDDGVGIPASELGRIFERFYRVDKARQRDTGGTGLGLAIVRHVVQNHGGEVEVASREGEGSTFTILLPFYEAAPVAVSDGVVIDVTDASPGGVP